MHLIFLHNDYFHKLMQGASFVKCWQLWQRLSVSVAHAWKLAMQWMEKMNPSLGSVSDPVDP
jgi:hypothetical protein